MLDHGIRLFWLLDSQVGCSFVRHDEKRDLSLSQGPMDYLACDGSRSQTESVSHGSCGGGHWDAVGSVRACGMEWNEKSKGESRVGAGER